MLCCDDTQAQHERINYQSCAHAAAWVDGGGKSNKNVLPTAMLLESAFGTHAMLVGEKTTPACLAQTLGIKKSSS